MEAVLLPSLQIMDRLAAHAVEQFNVMGNAVLQLRVIMDKLAILAEELINVMEAVLLPSLQITGRLAEVAVAR